MGGGIGLTPLQARVLEYVAAYVREHAYPPSYRQIMAALEIKSTSTIARVVDALIERERLCWFYDSLKVLAPPRPRSLSIVYGPGHWEDRARIKRAEYAREAA